MGQCCVSSSTDDMELATETDIYTIHMPKAIMTGANGFATDKSLKVINSVSDCEWPVIIINQGDTFSLETVQASIMASSSGGGASGHRAQREQESKISMEVLPKGTTRMRFHGDQTHNYFSFGFKVDETYRLFVIDKDLMPGSVVEIHKYPDSATSFIKDLVAETAGRGEVDIEFAEEFGEAIQMKWTPKKRELAYKFWTENDEPSSMMDVLGQDGAFDKFLKQLGIKPGTPIEKRARKWQKNHEGWKHFFDHLGIDDHEQLERAAGFMERCGFQKISDLVEEHDKLNQFYAEMDFTSKAHKTKAKEFFDKFRPAPMLKRHSTRSRVSENHADVIDLNCDGEPVRLRIRNNTIFVFPLEEDDNEDAYMKVKAIVFFHEDGVLGTIVAFLDKTEGFATTCDSTGQDLKPGPNWYHFGESGEYRDLCREAFNEMVDADEAGEWTLFGSVEDIQRFIKTTGEHDAFMNMYSASANGGDNVVGFEHAFNYNLHKCEQKLEGWCRRADVIVKTFTDDDDEDEVDMFMRRLHEDE